LNIHEILSAPRSPWQNLRRKASRLNPARVSRSRCRFERAWSARTLSSFFDYYQKSRTHLRLAKDAQIPRPVQLPFGQVIELPQVGGCRSPSPVSDSTPYFIVENESVKVRPESVLMSPWALLNPARTEFLIRKREGIKQWRIADHSFLFRCNNVRSL
jgi:hypothetical protein